MWKLIRYYRQVCIWLRIRHHHEHTAFRLPKEMTAREFYQALIPLGYQSITFPYCHVYPGQIFSLRRLAGLMQYHLRLWSDGTYTGHHEWNFEFMLARHMVGESVHDLDSYPREHNRIEEALRRGE